MNPSLQANLENAAEAVETGLSIYLKAIREGHLDFARSFGPKLLNRMAAAAWYLNTPDEQQTNQCRQWYAERFKNIPDIQAFPEK